MTSGPKLVNNQFNSPVKLYSQQAIQETLDRQTQILSNGAVGIDFNQLTKPTNLQNSAVLRMLEEEEERKRLGKADLKRVAWPPPKDEQQDSINFVEQGPVQAKTWGVGEYASYQSNIPTFGDDTPISCQSQSQPSLRQPTQFQVPQQQSQSTKPWATTSEPSASQPHPQQQQRDLLPSLHTWSSKPQDQVQIRQHLDKPLQSQPNPIIHTWDVNPQQQKQQQLSSSWNDQPQQTLIPVIQDHQNPQSYYQVQNIEPHFKPPPATITLRPEPPITQETSPVYQAQPAAINPNSGSMRGDQKWPPAPVKEQTEAENRARIELAKGPVFRPRRVNKDYSSFFAQHASTNNYPGYRAPPGTQYFTPAYHQH